MGVGGVLLHGSEGAGLGDLLHLSLRQDEAKEAADVTDASAQVLQDGQQKVRQKVLQLEVQTEGLSEGKSTSFSSS